MSRNHNINKSSFEMIQVLDNNINDMNKFINSGRFDSANRETIQTQIIWFKNQINCFEYMYNSKAIIERYNWVVHNLNSKLDLPREEQFEYYKAAA